MMIEIVFLSYNQIFIIFLLWICFNVIYDVIFIICPFSFNKKTINMFKIWLLSTLFFFCCNLFCITCHEQWIIACKKCIRGAQWTLDYFSLFKVTCIVYIIIKSFSISIFRCLICLLIFTACCFIYSCFWRDSFTYLCTTL